MASHLRLLCCMTLFGLLSVQQLPGVTGVFFSLDPVEIMDNGQATCGVLHCWEEVKPGSASIISSLTVYKQEAGRRVTLTTVSYKNPVDNGTFDNIEVDGIWTPEKAEAKLSLSQKNDCTQVQYSCQVRFTDEQGRERSSSAVVGGDDVTVPAMSEDTPLPSNKRSLTGKVSSPQDSTDDKITAMLAALETAQKTSSNMMETFVKEMKSVKDELKEDIASVEEQLKIEILSVKEEVKSVKEDIKSGITALEEDIQSVRRRMNVDKWIVIQRRSKGDVDFYRGWDSYKRGFGNPDGDFWLGNDRFHNLTFHSPHEMLVTIKSKGKLYFASYGSVTLTDEKDGYRLNVGNYSGTAKDALLFNNNLRFSTFDRDHDVRSGSNCAKLLTGAWWYGTCSYSNLNGKWDGDGLHSPFWNYFRGLRMVTFTEMKIREIIV